MTSAKTINDLASASTLSDSDLMIIRQGDATSDTKVSLASINAYVSVAVPSSTGAITEGDNLYYTNERVDDRVNALLQEGSNITLTYDDGAGTLTVAASVSMAVPSSTGAITEGDNLYYTDERVDDRVNTLLQEGSNITLTYDDGAGTLTVAASVSAAGGASALNDLNDVNTSGLADNHVLSYNASASMWTPSSVATGGGGDVTKVGTPANNEVGVWTGDGTIEGDSNLTWDGSDLTISGTGVALQGKQQLWIPAAAMTAGVTHQGPGNETIEIATYNIPMDVYAFDGTTTEYVYWQIPMPKSWDEGTITYQVYWSSSATDTDGVSWNLLGSSTADGDPIGQTWGSAIEVTDNNQSAARDLLVTTESSAVTIGGSPAADHLCTFRLNRSPGDANDTMDEDAYLIGVKLFYTTDAGNDA